MPVELYHRDLGGAGKPPLLLLHGLLGSSRNWQTAGAELASHHHVFALDLRNHGRSPHNEEMSFAEMVSDVLAWMDGHQIGVTTLLGHSLGGKVAMFLACRHPDRVKRLIVVDIAPKDYLSNAHRAEFAAMNELDLRSIQSRAEAELRFEGRVPDWAMRKFLATNLERAGDSQTWRWLINLPVLTRTLAGLESDPLTPADVFPGPARFIAGGNSAYLQSSDWASIQSHFPCATLEVIAGSGHNPHMEARGEFVRTVLKD